MVLGAITPGQAPQTRIVQPNVSSQTQTAAPSYVPDTAKTPSNPAGQGEFADYIKKYGAYVAIGVLLLLLLNKNN
jgi:hypothetical protein